MNTLTARTRTLCAAVVLLLACTGSPSPQGKEGDAAIEKPVPFPDYIAKRSAEFASASRLLTPRDVARLRIGELDALLAGLAAHPERISRIRGSHRGFLFDAVADCPCAARVGINDDGGKWVCNPHELPRPAIVYSFGAGGDISFDAGMAGQFGCDVFLFDPSPAVKARFPGPEASWQCGTGRISYTPLGIGPVSDEPGKEWSLVIGGTRCEVKSLEAIARSMGHTRVDILKMDIEGGEFAVLAQALASKSLQSLGVKQLLVEFHLWTDAHFAQFVALVGDLRRNGYLLFRKEFNPGDSEGVCAEYAFMKTDLVP
jgi:hypothetical protein